MAIRGLRLGSGVRFELKNSHDKEQLSTTWRINFFYGNSKNIKEKILDLDLFKRTYKIVDNQGEILNALSDLKSFAQTICEADLQLNWTNKDRTRFGPIQLVDKLADHASRITSLLANVTGIHDQIAATLEHELQNESGQIENKRIIENFLDIYTGILIGSIFNSVLEKKRFRIKSPMLHPV